MNTVKNTLTLKEFMFFVNDVFNAVFLENEDGSITFMPELYDYAMRTNVWRYYYAGGETGDLETDYSKLLGISLIDDSLFEAGINADQYCALEEAIQEKISFRKSQLIMTEKKDGLEQLIALGQKQMELEGRAFENTNSGSTPVPSHLPKSGKSKKGST